MFKLRFLKVTSNATCCVQLCYRKRKYILTWDFQFLFELRFLKVISKTLRVFSAFFYLFFFWKVKFFDNMHTEKINIKFYYYKLSFKTCDCAKRNNSLLFKRYIFAYFKMIASLARFSYRKRKYFAHQHAPSQQYLRL